MARVRVEGLRALQLRSAELAKIADKDSRGRAATLAASELSSVAEFARDSIRSSARAIGWPRRIIDTIFKFGDIRQDSLPRSVRASLVGVRRGAPPRRDEEIYREWRASGKNKSPNRKRGAGDLIGMSLASMYEFGTTKIYARPAFRVTYKAIQGRLRQQLIDGYKRIILELGK